MKKASAKKPAKKPVKKKSPRPAVVKKKLPVSKKKSATPDPKDAIGRVVAFFRIPVVAVVRLKRGTLKLGDQIWIKGHTTDLRLALASMQINHQPVQKIGKGDEAGVKVSSRARIGDRVYRIAG